MRDALGRCRQPSQSEGLRPLFPLLPEGVRSEVVRVAMSEAAWEALESAVHRSSAPTTPRAIGAVLERALGTSAGTADWQEWQIRKERQLLAS